MKKFLHITSKIDTIAYIDGQYAGVITCDHPLDIISDRKLYMTLNSQGYLPQAITLDCACDDIIDSDCMECIPYLNHHYDCNYTPIPMICPNYFNVIFSIILSKYYLCVLGGGKSPICNIQLFDNNKLKFSGTLEQFDDIDCTLFGNNIIVITKKDNTYAFMRIDTSECKLAEYYPCSKVSITKDSITTLRYLDDPVGQGVVSVYTTSSSAPEVYPVYRTDHAYPIDIDRLIPYGLLSCVEVKNFVHAKKYLSDNLATCKDSSLEKYFSDIQSIWPDPYTYSDNRYYYTVKSSEGYRKYIFEICDHKIVDIDEVK